jgi:hypothetical protein
MGKIDIGEHFKDGTSLGDEGGFHVMKSYWKIK